MSSEKPRSTERKHRDNIRKEMRYAHRDFTQAEMQHPSNKTKKARIIVAKGKSKHLYNMLKKANERKRAAQTTDSNNG